MDSNSLKLTLQCNGLYHVEGPHGFADCVCAPQVLMDFLVARIQFLRIPAPPPAESSKIIPFVAAK